MLPLLLLAVTEAAHVTRPRLPSPYLLPPAFKHSQRSASLATSLAIFEWFAHNASDSQIICMDFEEWAQDRFEIGPDRWTEQTTLALKLHANCTSRACLLAAERVTHVAGHSGSLQQWCEANHEKLRHSRQLLGIFAGGIRAIGAIGSVASIVENAAEFFHGMGVCDVCGTVAMIAGYISTGADCITLRVRKCADGVAGHAAEALGLNMPSEYYIAGQVAGPVLSGDGLSGLSGSSSTGTSHLGSSSRPCRYRHDGDCDDGGPGSEFSVCPCGSDYGDCAERVTCDGSTMQPPPPLPSPPPPVQLSSCHYRSDGDCDDGGPGSEYSLCPCGSDYGDCAERAYCDSGGGGNAVVASDGHAVVTSDGTAARPMCTWRRDCSWNAEIQGECANALCHASGYASGRFLFGNNMCTASDARYAVYYWETTRKEYIHATASKSSAVTADCIGHAPTPPPTVDSLPPPPPLPSSPPPPPLTPCQNSCVHAYDGDCDDGGVGAEYAICARGTDCNDCSDAEASVHEVCSNTCIRASNGVCDDGGADSEFSLCPYHTDCAGMHAIEELAQKLMSPC